MFHRIYQKFIMVSGLVLLAASISACALPEAGMKSLSQPFMAMDTIMTVTVYGRDEEKLEAAVSAMQEEVEKLDDMLSTGNQESEISLLNESGQGSVSEDVEALLAKSLEISKDTKGAFDITIYPVMKAWGFADGNFRVPDESELKSLLECVNYQRVNLDTTTHQVELVENTEIDLGGIAKGYTAEKLSALAQEMGIESAFLDLGGNIEAIGSKPDGSAWQVAIQNPDDMEAILCVVAVEDEGVVTSGGYQRYFEEDDMTYHHIIDPVTGYPAKKGLASVTIICEDSTLADGLSTALFVMGKEKALDYAKKHADEFACVLYTDDGNLYVSECLADGLQTSLDYQLISGK